MISEQRIAEALSKIEKLFVDQCQNGPQNQNLGSDAVACGQFLGPKAKDLAQRGLHGTAAALLVLAQGNTEAGSNLVPKLVQYIKSRESLFESGKEGSGLGNHTFLDDQQNVIKLSEVLYALSFVRASQSATDDLVSQIAGQLLAARIQNKGWTYFLGDATEVDILPTAFAILALSRHGYENQISGQIEFLKDSLTKQLPAQSDNFNETSVKIFCVYALAFRRDNLEERELSALKEIFVNLWKAHEGLLAHGLEQNIEYSRKSVNYYVRIPWQLYLFALAVRLDRRRLAHFHASQRIDGILTSISGDGFRYPYSGASISSRTNAILFDSLVKIRQFNNHSYLYWIYYFTDKLRVLLSHRIFSAVFLLAFFGITVFCIIAWVKNSRNPDEIGSGLVQGLLSYHVLYFLERLRKSK